MSSPVILTSVVGVAAVDPPRAHTMVILAQPVVHVILVVVIARRARGETTGSAYTHTDVHNRRRMR